jgi:hypothetical protein
MALGKKKKKSFVVVQDGAQASPTHKTRSRRIRMEWYEGHELFQTIHRLSPGEAAGHVQLNMARRVAWHTGVFAALMLFLGTPSWGIFWFMGLAAHGAKSLGALQKVFGDGMQTGIARLSGTEKLARPIGRSTTSPVETTAPERPAPKDALEPQLAEEWAPLDKRSDSLGDVCRGNASQLDAAIGAPTLAGSTDLSDWCTPSTAVAFGFGDRGTPGGANIVCPVR